MADKTVSVFATGRTNQVLTVDGPAAGLQWILYQWSVETSPFEAGASVVVRRNGRLITSSSSGGRASAQGPPAFLFSPGDQFTVEWDGVASGDELIFSFMYREQQYGELPDGYGVV